MILKFLVLTLYIQSWLGLPGSHPDSTLPRHFSSLRQPPLFTFPLYTFPPMDFIPFGHFPSTSLIQLNQLVLIDSLMLSVSISRVSQFVSFGPRTMNIHYTILFFHMLLPLSIICSRTSFTQITLRFTHLILYNLSCQLPTTQDSIW